MSALTWLASFRYSVTIIHDTGSRQRQIGLSYQAIYVGNYDMANTPQLRWYWSIGNNPAALPLRLFLHNFGFTLWTHSYGTHLGIPLWFPTALFSLFAYRTRPPRRLRPAFPVSPLPAPPQPV